MKRITLILMGMLFASLVGNAYAGDFFVTGFEDGETGYEVNTEWAAGYTWEIVANSDAAGINNSDKCLMTTTTGSDIDRWGLWVTIKLTTPVTITQENRYFKMMVKRSPNQTNMGLHQKEQEGYYFGQTKPAKAGVWSDLVFDLFRETPSETLENKEVQTFLVCLGTWDGTEAGICMMDNIVLSDNSKPRGANEIAAGLLLNFDNANLTAANFAGFEVQSASASATITNNPKVSAINPSLKSLVYNKPANTIWWHALQSKVNGIVAVEYPNIYLHLMMHIPDASPATVIVSSPSGKGITEAVYPFDGEDWQDYVFDVSSLDYIHEIMFRFNQTTEENWENPSGQYYVDDFVLNSDSEARTAISAGIKNIAIGDKPVISVRKGEVTVNAAQLKTVNIYSVNGLLVKQLSAIGDQVNFLLGKGFYVLQTESQTGNRAVQKLVVQ
ncbi:hypothetical protein FACS1894162_1510 [Bacteroidia bacterium]|nr:hypothetical protein FACS1894162_1510 [Bacteroidia bacterium]